MDLAPTSIRAIDPPHVQEPLVVDMMVGKFAGCVGSGFNRDTSPAQKIARV